MLITSLGIKNFRNLVGVELCPSPHLNIIYGNNASGKTSLLEAIHYLSLGRSFRNLPTTRLINYSANQFSLFAKLISAVEQFTPLGIERNLNGTMRIRLAEKDIATVSELAHFLPIRVLNTHSHQLFELGPVFRRKYLDWGLFYQSEGFLSAWRHFERVLKQRNTLLRDKCTKSELNVWTTELVKHGLELDELRQNYVRALTPIILEVVQELLPISNLEIKYLPGWENNSDYASQLMHAYQDELRLGYTQLGPHRADLDLTIDDVSVRHLLSRGQQKLLICAMIVAQGMLLARHANRRLIYLVDDLPSELDLQSKQRLISLLSKQQTQIFITSIESEAICDFISNQSNVPMKLFHVEHGSVIEMA